MGSLYSMIHHVFCLSHAHAENSLSIFTIEFVEQSCWLHSGDTTVIFISLQHDEKSVNDTMKMLIIMVK